MDIWKKGLAVLALILFIWAVKSSYETRVIASIAVIAALYYFGTKRGG